MAEPRGTPDAAGLRRRLHRLRDRVDAIDREIVGLMNERAALAVEIGQIKAANGDGVLDEEREREVLQRVIATSDGPLPAAEIESIYRRLIEATRTLEERDRVAHRESPG